ncbi:MAG: hypothetical protein R2909_15320 [Gemmatimonadales bacterium]
MKRLSLWMLAAVTGLAACSGSEDSGPLAPAEPELRFGSPNVIWVTNSNDGGAGSFRAAVQRANASRSVKRIEFVRGLGSIPLASPVVYTGEQALDIRASGTTLDGSGLGATDPAAFLANGGGDLTVVGLNVRNAPQEGLTVQVPASATGTQKVSLINCEIVGNMGHGVLINDQVDPEDTDNSAGSAASVDVTVVSCRFADNGFGALDRDGLRINEGGDGHLLAQLSLVQADHNGADGIEFDERGPGDVRFYVSATHVTRNGSYDQTLADLDDGFDVDEADEGDLIAKVILSSANDNYEEGFDFNENHEGDFKVEMTLVEASRNLEEGIDFEEDDDFQGGGDLITTLIAVKANGNGPGGDAGLKIRERGDGSIDATVKGAETNDNQIGGIEIREDAAGDLRASVERAVALRNVEDGIKFDENGDGELIATLKHSNSSNNGEAGVAAEQQSPGAGLLDVIKTLLNGNTGGPIDANSGVVVTQKP